MSTISRKPKNNWISTCSAQMISWDSAKTWIWWTAMRLNAITRRAPDLVTRAADKYPRNCNFKIKDNQSRSTSSYNQMWPRSTKMTRCPPSPSHPHQTSLALMTIRCTALQDRSQLHSSSMRMLRMVWNRQRLLGTYGLENKLVKEMSIHLDNYWRRNWWLCERPSYPTKYVSKNNWI